jgi:hypothetical protein
MNELEPQLSKVIEIRGDQLDHQLSYCLLNLRKPCDPWKTIETGIKGQNSFDAMPFHDGQMQCISRGKPLPTQNNFFGAFCGCKIDGKYLIDDAEQRVKRSLNRIATVDRNVTVQNLLQYFRIGDQTLPFRDEPFK